MRVFVVFLCLMQWTFLYLSILNDVLFGTYTTRISCHKYRLKAIIQMAGLNWTYKHKKPSEINPDRLCVGFISPVL